MHRHATRDRLVLPVAAIVALGLVSVPHEHGSAAAAPKVTEFAAVRLQAEVTSLVTGVVAAAAAQRPVTTTAPAPAAAGNSFTYNPNYTWLDNLVASLPDKVRYAILPPLYVMASVLGLVIGIAQLAITPIVRLFNPNSTFPFPSAAVAAPAVTAPAVTAPSVTGQPGSAVAPSSAPGEVARPDASVMARPAAGTRRPALIADAVATARAQVRARVLAAVPAAAATAANAATGVEVPVTDGAATPAAAEAIEASPAGRAPRALRRPAARAASDAAPATPRAKRSAR